MWDVFSVSIDENMHQTGVFYWQKWMHIKYEFGIQLLKNTTIKLQQNYHTGTWGPVVKEYFDFFFFLQQSDNIFYIIKNVLQ